MSQIAVERPEYESALRVLIVDDDRDESYELERLLDACPDVDFEVARVQCLEEGLQQLRDSAFQDVWRDNAMRNKSA